MVRPSSSKKRKLNNARKSKETSQAIRRQAIFNQEKSKVAVQVAFLIFAMALGRFGLPKDREVWQIMSLFTAAHILLGIYVWPVASWVMVCVGAIECLNIATIKAHAWNRTGKLLSAILAFLSLWSCLFYVDFQSGTYVIYGYYTEIITLATIAMIAIGSDGALHIFTNITGWVGDHLSRGRPIVVSGEARERSSHRGWKR